MSFLDQMKLPGLIILSLIFIPASNSKGENWTVNVTRRINTTLHSNVTIPCTFTYPTKYHTKDVQVYWKKPVKSPVKTNDKNVQALIFHPNDSYVLQEYRGRTKLIGNKTNGDCSLLIQNIPDKSLDIYLRIIIIEKNGTQEQWSYDKDSEFVFIRVSNSSDSGVTAPTFQRDSQTSPTSEMINSTPLAPMFTAICVPVAALLIILFVAGIICYRRHKRSQSFTREESGYYANFSRAPSTQAERDASGKKQENKKLPELKAIDEPIYINTEVPVGQMDQSMDQMDNVYANVDYTK